MPAKFGKEVAQGQLAERLQTEARMANARERRQAVIDQILGPPPSKNLRLSRGERDHIAGHALDDLGQLGRDLEAGTRNGLSCSSVARTIAALSNLLGDIGWERGGLLPEFSEEVDENRQWWTLGELFPVPQLRPWLEEWQQQDNEALVKAEQALELLGLGEPDGIEPNAEQHTRRMIADAQTKLGTGAILLARLEKWMASHGN